MSDCRGHIDHIRLGPCFPDEEWSKERDVVFAQILAGIKQQQKWRNEMSVLRCKMRVAEVLHSKSEDGSTNQERVKLSAVYGKEGTDNAQWSKWTPSANFEISINNPGAFNKLSQGHEFYVDFTPAEQESETGAPTKAAAA